MIAMSAYRRSPWTVGRGMPSWAVSRVIPWSPARRTRRAPPRLESRAAPRRSARPSPTGAHPAARRHVGYLQQEPGDDRVARRDADHARAPAAGAANLCQSSPRVRRSIRAAPHRPASPAHGSAPICADQRGGRIACPAIRYQPFGAHPVELRRSPAKCSCALRRSSWNRGSSRIAAMSGAISKYNCRSVNG